MKALRSYLGTVWDGEEPPAYVPPLVNPATGEPVATIMYPSRDLSATLTWAQKVGRAALGEMSFAERRAIVQLLADVIKANRDELLALAQLNGGKTLTEASFDVDGARITAMDYASLAESEPDWLDGPEVQLLRKNPDYIGRHFWAPLAGAAVLINAFNFPVWGFVQKAVRAILAGLPIICRPSLATALVTHRLFELLVENVVFPEGVMQLYLGPLGTHDDLLGRLRYGDVVSFTGSLETARQLRRRPDLVDHHVRIHVEADSLNAAVLGPDVQPGSPAYELFLSHVVTEMTFMAGQKCTAFRRLFVTSDRLVDVRDDLSQRLAAVKIGDPSVDGVTMGPLATARQLQAAKGALPLLRQESRVVFGTPNGAVETTAEMTNGFFFGPMLLEFDRPTLDDLTHTLELFGPVATLIPYDGQAASAGLLARRAGGSLVGAVYSDDPGFVAHVARSLSSDHGRLYLANGAIADMKPSAPGTTLAALNHGGPGRAGEGSELGGWHGLQPFMNRVAIQGHRAMVDAVTNSPVKESV